MIGKRNLLPYVLAHPEHSRSLDESQWSDLLSQARRGRVLARLAAMLEQSSALSSAPAMFQESGKGARIYADHLQRRALFEIRRLESSLASCNTDVVLLKGAAYLAQDSAAATGRGLSDIDILVSRAQLPGVEAHLGSAGWAMKDKLSEYDEFYYREYTHELPPHWHAEFQFELDIHHNILQLTHRLAIDADKLLQRTRPIQGSRFLALSAEDQVLHSATHLTMSDELRGGLRDVHDIKLLIDEAQLTNPGFIDHLATRATELNLGRPLFYCLDFMERAMGMRFTGTLQQSMKDWAPSQPVLSMMRALVDHRFLPSESPTRLDDIGEQLLYLRSHWIRMPPLQLARHLSTKAMMRMRGEA